MRSLQNIVTAAILPLPRHVNERARPAGMYLNYLVRTSLSSPCYCLLHPKPLFIIVGFQQIKGILDSNPIALSPTVHRIGTGIRPGPFLSYLSPLGQAPEGRLVWAHTFRGLSPWCVKGFSGVSGSLCGGQGTEHAEAQEIDALLKQVPVACSLHLVTTPNSSVSYEPIR